MSMHYPGINTSYQIFIVFLLLLLNTYTVFAQFSIPDQPKPLGIAMENYEYPYQVHFLPLTIEGQDVRLAFMDIQPVDKANGMTVVLMHGKNFFGAYWSETIKKLSQEGFRVVVPDQIGFGKSSKPLIHYSFHRMGNHTKKLLDTLGIEKVAVAGHSMGGMAAARFTLMYPERVTHLILENPIGLEDYRRLTPWISLEEIYNSIIATTYDRIRNYHESYYVEWDEAYDEYVQVHYRWTFSGDYPRLAYVSALTSRMIYEQPVIHEFQDIKRPVLLIIGLEDRTAPGSGRAEPEIARAMGYYPDLGKQAAELIPDATLIELKNVGHTPHFEAKEKFHDALLHFLIPQ
ncbi:MAG: alpha/beta hydrolase [Balneolaceae bacterium]